ncbi:MAG: hypothetical protein HETSPECPRED_005370 [Heterodermia speciosa]|uniref:N-acetyltransferase domain-containing protein n=1 Tax=Heterodermia speciosa TaxID=116794 RepID=A0A8H3ILP4_9LECA|nr:MAG: hypothetical protein HETSPECPRED_005370 [Heterodermia speciosa]
MSLPPSYSLSSVSPSPEAYNALRLACGLDPFTLAAATLGLPNSLFTIVLLYHLPESSHSDTNDPPASESTPRKTSESEIIGMGRVTGDGGCFYQVTDICVLPSHRGKGLAKVIMAEIEKWLKGNVPETGLVALLADGEAYRLYEQFGFRLSAPASLGMSRVF